MRVLLVEDDVADALLVEEALGPHHDVRTIASVQDGLRQLAGDDWRPDVIVVDLEWDDGETRSALESLRAAVPEIPVLLSAAGLIDALSRQRAPAVGIGPMGAPAELVLLRALARQQQSFNRVISGQRVQIMAEIEKVAMQAAETVVSRAVDELMARLGFDDTEGVRLAVRLARGWEAAKARFVSALATGIASALLVAIGAGIIAMLRQNSTK